MGVSFFMMECRGVYLGRVIWGRSDFWFVIVYFVGFGVRILFFIVGVLIGFFYVVFIVIYIFCEGWRFDLCC